MKDLNFWDLWYSNRYIDFVKALFTMIKIIASKLRSANDNKSKIFEDSDNYTEWI